MDLYFNVQPTLLDCGFSASTLIGIIVPIDFSGIEFSMTALFIVILIEQIQGNTRKIKISAVVGAIAGVLCLLIFGANNFLLFALVITTLEFLLLKIQKIGPHVKSTKTPQFTGKNRP